MPRPKSIPKLCRHKASGQAVVSISGRDRYLGPFGSAEAQENYDRLIAEWLASGRLPYHSGGINDDCPILS